MKTGIELVAQERDEQITKHGFTNEYTAEHPEYYKHEQLTVAAIAMLDDVPDIKKFPGSWDNLEMIERMAAKPYVERLTIAAALLCAEIDRVIYNIYNYEKVNVIELSEENYTEFMDVLDAEFEKQYPDNYPDGYSKTLSKEQWLLDWHGSTVQDIITGEVESWEED